MEISAKNFFGKKFNSWSICGIFNPDKDSLRELHGFFFTIDEKMAIYDFRRFGKANFNRSVALLLERNNYSYCHGRRKSEKYSQRDIRPGMTLSQSSKFSTKIEILDASLIYKCNGASDITNNMKIDLNVIGGFLVKTKRKNNFTRHSR